MSVLDHWPVFDICEPALKSNVKLAAQLVNKNGIIVTNNDKMFYVTRNGSIISVPCFCSHIKKLVVTMTKTIVLSEKGELFIGRTIIFSDKILFLPFQSKHVAEDISCTDLHLVVLTKEGKILALSFFTDRTPIVIDDGSQDWAYIVATDNFIVAVTKTNEMYLFQDYTRFFQSSLFEKPPMILSGVKKVVHGFSHILVLTQMGHLFSYGSNLLGQLGVEDRYRLKEEYSLPSIVLLSLKKQIVDIGAGGYLSTCITIDNEIYVWGDYLTKTLYVPTHQPKLKSLHQPFTQHYYSLPKSELEQKYIKSKL